MKEIPNSEFTIDANLVIIAIGFIHPEQKDLIKKPNLEKDKKGMVKTDKNLMTSKKESFSAGDMRKGQSLIVKAICDGRKAANSIDSYL